MWFLVILNALAKNISRSFAKNLFLRKQRKGECPMTSPQRGGPGGHPPRHSHDTGTSKSPSEAVFINYQGEETTVSSYDGEGLGRAVRGGGGG